MIKTITDLQPFVYAQMFAQRERRRFQRHQVLTLTRWLILPVLYTTISLKITFDTGIHPGDWRFLLMFVPLFLVGSRRLSRFAVARSGT